MWDGAGLLPVRPARRAPSPDRAAAWDIRFAAWAMSGIGRASIAAPRVVDAVDPGRPDERVDDLRVELDAGELAELAERPARS